MLVIKQLFTFFKVRCSITLQIKHFILEQLLLRLAGGRPTFFCFFVSRQFREEEQLRGQELVQRRHPPHRVRQQGQENVRFFFISGTFGAKKFHRIAFFLLKPLNRPMMWLLLELLTIFSKTYKKLLIKILQTFYELLMNFS